MRKPLFQPTQLQILARRLEFSMILFFLAKNVNEQTDQMRRQAGYAGWPDMQTGRHFNMFVCNKVRLYRVAAKYM